MHVRNGYRLEVDPGLVDSVQFTRGLEESRLRMATAPDTVATELRRVLAMWRGRPYADLMDVPGLEPEIRRLEFLRLEAVELRIEAELVSGHHFEL
ncbi:MAG TPA: BTAD domain-containing putative transcriptional regulator [Acidimicrobiia bacterium]|nr:BTAD domain-containing putative transcriptional regulator [Acidimicrobiia bacterium]